MLSRFTVSILTKEYAYLTGASLYIVAISIVVGMPLIFDADAYYYFQIARNISNGAGSTFDGVSVTTGYHPLWMGFLTTLHFLFQGVSSIHYAVHGILIVLFLAGWLLLWIVAKTIGISPTAFILASLIVLAPNMAVFQSGLENTLLFFLLALLIFLQYRTWNDHRTKVAAIALVLLLAYFTRLDSIFLIAIYLPYHLVTFWRSGNHLAAILLPAVVAAGVFAHWAFMLVNFDTIFPTSKLAIQETQQMASILDALVEPGPTLTTMLRQILDPVDFGSFANLVRYVGLATPLVLVVSLFVVARKRFMQRLPIFMIGLMAVLQLFYYVVVVSIWTREWYYTGWFIIVLFAVSLLLSNVKVRYQSVLGGVLIVVLLTVSIAANVDRRNPTWASAIEEGQLLHDYDKPGNVIVALQPDRATYFSGVPMRHIEGKVNSYEYIRSYLLPGRVTAYLDDIGATHYVYSNEPIPSTGIPCKIQIATSKEGTLYGEYDRHVNNVWVYLINDGPAPALTSVPTVPSCDSD
ncbi:MAG: hypothetical protein IIA92_11685 [Chloroflexi bacterium]|nr:hypothetical protein [Chloroflexota bacterium]